MRAGVKYALAGVGFIGITYLVIAIINRRKDDDLPVEEDPQTKPDPVLTDAVVESTTIGMKIYSKVDGVKIRTQAMVNDGLLNNVYDTVPTKNTLMGKIVRIVVGPKDQINPATKRPYNWFSFQLDKALYQTMQKNRWFINRDTSENIPPPLKTWVREDVVYGKK
jgi:hypothetical protein